MDRTYFKSLYIRDPDGHIVELATEGPGFSPEAPRPASEGAAAGQARPPRTGSGQAAVSTLASMLVAEASSSAGRSVLSREHGRERDALTVRERADLLVLRHVRATSGAACSVCVPSASGS